MCARSARAHTSICKIALLVYALGVAMLNFRHDRAHHALNRGGQVSAGSDVSSVATPCFQKIAQNLESFAAAGCAHRHVTLQQARESCIRNPRCGGITKDNGIVCPPHGRAPFELRRGNLLLSRGESSWLLHRTAAAGTSNQHATWCHSLSHPFERVPRSLLYLLPDFVGRRSISALVGHDKLHVLVLGGSMAAGSGCVDGTLRPYECAWSGRFAKALERSLGMPIELANRARGGTQSAVALAGISSLLGEDRFDLVFTDFSVNDVAQIAGQQEVEGDLGRVTEGLIESLHRLLPDAVHVLLIQDCPGCRAGEQMSSVLDPGMAAATTSSGLAVPLRDWAAVKMVAAAHRVPVLDLRLPCSLGGNCTWAPKDTPVHPNAEAHKAIADQVLFAFEYASRSDRRGSVYSGALLAPLMECLRPLRSYDAHSNASSARLPSSTGPVGSLADTDSTRWHLTAEGRSKPGWVTRTVGDSITFDMQFGRHPSLTMGYLRSYTGLGTVELSLNGRSHVLDPRWSQHISMTEASFMQVGSDFYQVTGELDQRGQDLGLKGFGVKGFSRLPLTIKFLGPHGTKFKLVSVSSC